MSEHELDPVECHIMGMSVDKVARIDLSQFKRLDSDGGRETTPNTSQIPEFVLRRTSKVVPIDDTEVK